MGSPSVNIGLLESVIGDWLQGSFQMFIENTPLSCTLNTMRLTYPYLRRGWMFGPHSNTS